LSTISTKHELGYVFKEVIITKLLFREGNNNGW